MCLQKKSIFIFYVALFLLITNATCLNARVSRTPAQVLAKQTGATLYEERFESTDCDEHKHRLKKRASDEDVDYEVYQGVVGRPGIDFPIFPRIPQTTFSCRTFGNGYFADLETDCQVFHICEEGRKISFLCPNGTIFQQSELTCDWWFKVNCAGSPGLYAESSEILHKARRQKVRPTVSLKDFQIVNGPTAIGASAGAGAGLAPLHEKNAAQRFRIHNKSDRRIDSNEEPSLESVDFEDISSEKQLNSKSVKNIDPLENNNNENEFQITAESASFVGNQRRLNYNHDKPDNKNVDRSGKNYQEDNYNRNLKKESSSRRNKESTRQHGNSVRNNLRADSSEKVRSSSRGTHRYESKTHSEKTSSNNRFDEDRTEENLSRENRNNLNTVVADGSTKPEYFTSSPANIITDRNSGTQSYPGTYSTARRIESTKSTPFYTPTIPSVIKVKPTETKAPKAGDNLENPAPCSTYIPVAIGLRLNRNKSSEIHRFSLTSSGEINVDVPVYKAVPERSTETAALNTTFGSTFLPQNFSTVDKANKSILFVNSPAQEESLTRNVNEMIQTVNMIKNTIKEAAVNEEKNFQGKVRSGLEIPPSSGPDAIVSFASYFANEGASKSAASPIAEASSATTLPTPSTDDIRSGLLTDKIIKQYSTLFGLEDLSDDEGRLMKKELPDGLATGLPNNASEQIGSTSISLKDLAQKPETRQIARVFSNALTTYLEDPESFRQQLAEARPKEPPTIDGKDNSIIDAATDPTLVERETAATYLPTKTTITSFDSQATTTIQSNDIAVEINRNFDSSTPIFDSNSSTEKIEFTTTTTTTTTSGTATIPPQFKIKLDLSEELLPPNLDDSEEFLQRSQTQSFVKSMNELSNGQRLSENGKQLSNYKVENSKKSTETPISPSLGDSSPTVYLDPLTINDGLMNQIQTTTSSPFTYLPTQERTAVPQREQTTTTQATSTTTTTTTTLAPNKRTFKTPISLLKSSRNTFSESTNQRAETFDEFGEILESPELSQELFPSTSGLQRIANKLFGGLNEVEAQHLQNVMQQAENNRNVLKLLLLLIQTCDDHNGKILEKSRKSLLNALIEMDELKQRQTIAQSRPEKYIESSRPTTNRIPVTTYRGSFDVTTTLSPPTNTAQPDYSTTMTTTDGSQSIEETTKFEIRVAEPDEELANTSPPPSPSSLVASTSTTTTSRSDNHFNRGRRERGSDQRALGLLKSLYSLASKFNNRR